MTVTVSLPCRLVSEANSRGHWAKGAKRAKGQRELAYYMLQQHRGALRSLFFEEGIAIHLTRIAPRVLDEDNLQRAFKAIRDGVADAFKLDDGDPRLAWRYHQRKGPGPYGAYGCEIRIEIALPTQEHVPPGGGKSLREVP